MTHQDDLSWKARLGWKALAVALAIGLGGLSVAGMPALSDEAASGAADASAAGDAAEPAWETYAPTIYQADDGTLYQRTPSEVGWPGRLDQPDSIKPYNTYWLKADQRGCNSCHDNLADLVENMPDYQHIGISSGVVDDVTIDACDYCHVGGSSSQPRPQQFGTLIHSIHGIGADGTSDISCWACHDANENGDGITMWDRVKYDRLAGITQVAAEDIPTDGAFTWDQDRTVSQDDFFNVAWQISDRDDLIANADARGDEFDQSVFDNWTFSVNGEVNNPTTFNLSDLIDQGLSVTQDICLQCVDNPTGGGLLGQVEVTGIPLSALVEQCGLKDDATSWTFVDVDGSEYYPYDVAWLDADSDTDVLLVYEINGEHLSWGNGYPLYGIIGGQEAYKDVKFVAGINVTAEEGEGHYSENGLNYANTPNIGNMDTHEGQIIQAGEPYTFGGYAYAYNNQITGVEFSLDNGESWVHFDTPDSDFNRWVSWEFTWTPPADVDTAYVLQMRSVMADGTTTADPVKVMVNAKTTMPDGPTDATQE